MIHVIFIYLCCHIHPHSGYKHTQCFRDFIANTHGHCGHKRRHSSEMCNMLNCEIQWDVASWGGRSKAVSSLELGSGAECRLGAEVHWAGSWQRCTLCPGSWTAGLAPGWALGSAATQPVAGPVSSCHAPSPGQHVGPGHQHHQPRHGRRLRPGPAPGRWIDVLDVQSCPVSS